MPTLEFSSVRRSWAARTRHHTKRAVRRGAPELRTLIKFTLVGGSGFILNLAVFSAVEKAGAHYLIAATCAFLVAVGNNFHWNRRWTFDAVGDAAIHRQAQRFLIVSVVGYFIGIGILTLLIDAATFLHLVAQTAQLIIVTPIGFLGNRLWTFAAPGAIGRLVGRVRGPRATPTTEI